MSCTERMGGVRMVKAELRKLPRMDATQGMMAEVLRQRHTLFLRARIFGKYLKVAVFLPEKVAAGICTPRFEIFIDPDGLEWITRALDDAGLEEKWLKAMIKNLPWPPEYGLYCYPSRIKRQFMTRATVQNIDALPCIGKTEKKGIERIWDWQLNISQLRLKAAEAKEQKPWDDDMALIPPVTDSFIKWLKKEGPEKNYLFYEYQKGGARTAYCMRCGKDVRLKRMPYHRKKGCCPVCGKTSEFISVGRVGRVEYSGGGILIQRIRGGFVLRQFDVGGGVSTDKYRTQELYWAEVERILWRDGKIDVYRYGAYKNKYDRWNKTKISDGKWSHRDFRADKVYPRTLPALMDTLGRRSGLAAMLRSGLPVNAAGYMKLEMDYPYVELIAKAGLARMVQELIDGRIYSSAYFFHRMVDASQTSLTSLLRIDRARLGRLVSMGSGIAHLEWLQLEKEEDTVWPDETIQYFAGGNIRPLELDEFRRRLSLVKIHHYLLRQQAVTGETVHQALCTWRDYLNMARQLKMDLGKDMILRPKDLKTAHDDLVELLMRDGMLKTAMAVAKRFPEVEKVCGTLGKYEYTDGTYCIRAPKGIYDIVREGTILKHCVHSCDYYYDRISQRESYLLFLRRAGEEDNPWYTLEVEPGGNIRQKRTTGDNQNEDLKEALPFLRKWQTEIKKRLTEEEKSLAREADRKRKKNIAKLRENGNKIWHGRLQGKLLADVLEQDFMEVT